METTSGNKWIVWYFQYILNSGSFFLKILNIAHWRSNSQKEYLYFLVLSTSNKIDACVHYFFTCEILQEHIHYFKHFILKYMLKQFLFPSLLSDPREVQISDQPLKLCFAILSISDFQLCSYFFFHHLIWFLHEFLDLSPFFSFIIKTDLIVINYYIFTYL